MDKAGREPDAVRAAVVRRAGGAFEIVPVTLGPPRADEIVVDIVATGICHTDLIVRDGVLPAPFPIMLGHEGAGIVRDVGEAVRSVVAGDHVVLSFVSCGHCRPCHGGHVASCERFGPLNFGGCRPDGSHAAQSDAIGTVHDRFFGQSSFSTMAIASERNVVKVRRDAPLHLLGPLGCGIQTGAGAILNVLGVGAGSSVAVFGSGAVGLSAVMAAVVAGATTIVAVDRVDARLDLARAVGATHVVDTRAEDAVDRVRAIAPGGVDHALDTTGIAAVIRDAVAALRPRGACGMVGASSRDVVLTLPATDFMVNSKRLIGIIEGDSVPHLFIPQLIDLFMQGRFPFDRLVELFPFDRINEAAEASEKGRVVKPIVMMPGREATAGGG